MRIPRALAAVAAATLFIMSIGVSAHADDTVTPEPVVTATTEASAPPAAPVVVKAAVVVKAEVTTPPPVVTPDPPKETTPEVTTPAPVPAAPTTSAPAAPTTSSAPEVTQPVETTTPSASESSAPPSAAPETTKPTEAPKAVDTSIPSTASPSGQPVVAAGEGPTTVIEDPSTGVIESIERVGCDVNITVTTHGPGFWSLAVYDDGEQIGLFWWITSTDDAHTAVWTIPGPAGTDSPGIGFFLALGATGIDQVDPWFYPHHVGEACGAEEVPTELTLPGYTGSITAGSPLAVHGTGYGPDEDVMVSFDDTLVGTFHTDEAGTFSGTITVPAGTDTGKHQVTGVGATSEKSACAKVKVVAPTATIGEISRDGCNVSIPVTTTGPGSYKLEVWDDGEVIDTFTWVVTTPGVKTIVWTITRPAGTAASGVAFMVSLGSTMLDLVDNYMFPDDVANKCSAAVPVTILLPGYTGSTTAGSTLQVTGTGYLPNEQVKLVFASTPTDVGTATTDATGTYLTTFVVPAGATVDIHHLTATGVTSGRAATIEVNVVAAVVPGEVLDATLTLPADTLANTGSDINPGFAALALTSVVAGAGALALGRRRRSMTE